MSYGSKLFPALAALALAVTALAGCTPSASEQTVGPQPTSFVIPTPTPHYVTELPEWAKVSAPWIVYPPGFKCEGTEGCANDFRALIGKPGPVLPEGVIYYDPAVHDCVEVWPLGMECAG